MDGAMDISLLLKSPMVLFGNLRDLCGACEPLSSWLGGSSTSPDRAGVWQCCFGPLVVLSAALPLPFPNKR